MLIKSKIMSKIKIMIMIMIKSMSMSMSMNVNKHWGALNHFSILENSV